MKFPTFHCGQNHLKIRTAKLAKVHMGCSSEIEGRNKITQFTNFYNSIKNTVEHRL